MKTLSLLVVLVLSGCTTDPASGKTLIGGRTWGEWGYIGLAGGKAAFPAVKDAYLKTPKVEVTSAK